MVSLITEHIDIWTAAQTQKKNGGRGRGKNTNGQIPHGIKKLRELILELAVRGKLVPQDPEDEPASVLLEKIAREKARLIREGKIKKQKPLPEMDENEKPFELPMGWEWARLPSISAYRPGKTPLTKNPVYWSDDVADFPWVSISDMEHFGTVADTTKRITQAAVDHVFKYDAIPAGTLLMSFKLTVGKISILDIDAYHNEAIISIQPFRGISRAYLFKFLPNRALAGKTKSAIKGNTLNATSLGLLSIPIPPLDEQHRIVAKVDELMALCDQLEQEQSESNSTHQTLVETLLATLTTAADQDELAEAWQRIAGHFDTLFTTEQSIDQLKQTILQLAVMGKLVPQDPNEEPASVLLERIAKERSRLIKEGKIKKQKPLPEIAEDEKPFQLPVGWEWIRLGTLSEIKGGKRLPKGHSFSTFETPYIYVQVTNMKGGTITQDNLKYISEETHSEISRYTISKDDLYITIAGTIGDVGMVPEVFDGVNLTENAAKIVFSKVDKSWLQKTLSSKVLKQQFSQKTNQLAQPKLALHRVASSCIAIPPLAEQHRIVVKVDELMALCDALKARLNEAQSTQAQLADAIAAQAVA